MKLLALDSSSTMLSVALLDGEVLISRSAQAGQSHSDQVLPLVDAVLAEGAVSRHALDVIAFGAGPGAFTGLRLTCAVVQGLAFALELPVVSVGTLDAMALRSGAEYAYCCLDARQNEVYCAAYRVQNGVPERVFSPVVVAPADAPLPESGSWLGCGDGFAAYAEALQSRLGSWIVELRPEVMPHAEAIARLGKRGFEQGAAVDAQQAVPIYVRDKVALTTAERLARGGKA